MSDPLVLCACGSPATVSTYDEHTLCDRCNDGLSAPHPQAVSLPWPPWLLQRRRERLTALLLDEGLGLYDLHEQRWLNTLAAVEKERDEARMTSGVLLAILEGVSERLTAEESAGVAEQVARATRRNP